MKNLKQLREEADDLYSQLQQKRAKINKKVAVHKLIFELREEEEGLKGAVIIETPENQKANRLFSPGISLFGTLKKKGYFVYFLEGRQNEAFKKLQAYLQDSKYYHQRRASRLAHELDILKEFIPK